jgi:hypothetical protein
VIHWLVEVGFFVVLFAALLGIRALWKWGNGA